MQSVLCLAEGRLRTSTTTRRFCIQSCATLNHRYGVWPLCFPDFVLLRHSLSLQDVTRADGQDAGAPNSTTRAGICAIRPEELAADAAVRGGVAHNGDGAGVGAE